MPYPRYTQEEIQEFRNSDPLGTAIMTDEDIMKYLAKKEKDVEQKTARKSVTEEETKGPRYEYSRQEGGLVPEAILSGLSGKLCLEEVCEEAERLGFPRKRWDDVAYICAKDFSLSPDDFLRVYYTALNWPLPPPNPLPSILPPEAALACATFFSVNTEELCELAEKFGFPKNRWRKVAEVAAGSFSVDIEDFRRIYNEILERQTSGNNDSDDVLNQLPPDAMLTAGVVFSVDGDADSFAQRLDKAGFPRENRSELASTAALMFSTSIEDFMKIYSDIMNK